MKGLLYVLIGVVRFGVGAIQLCMFIRAVMSWFPVDDDNPILVFTYSVTEPFIVPVRMLLERFGIGDDSPIDVAFLLTIILLSVLTIVL